MPADDRHAIGEPLAPWWCEVRAAEPGLRRLRFEVTSRGDRVPGLLWLPERPAPRPLILLGHGAGGSKQSPELAALVLPWVRRGAAVASIDWPLHGERASGKLTGLLLESLGDRARPPRGALATLWEEVARQARSDLGRALDWLETLEALDPARIAYVAFGLGALLGAPFCARDRRLRAVVLGDIAAGIGPPGLDPLHAVPHIAPRPLLLVNAGDGSCPRAAARALYEAAAEPREQLWLESARKALPASGVTALARFLRLHLALEADGAGRAAFPPPRGRASPGS